MTEKTDKKPKKKRNLTSYPLTFGIRTIAQEAVPLINGWITENIPSRQILAMYLERFPNSPTSLHSMSNYIRAYNKTLAADIRQVRLQSVADTMHQTNYNINVIMTKLNDRVNESIDNDDKEGFRTWGKGYMDIVKLQNQLTEAQPERAADEEDMSAEIERKLAAMEKSIQLKALGTQKIIEAEVKLLGTGSKEGDEDSGQKDE